MQTTVGKILLKHSVPADLIPYVENTPLDKKGLGGLFNQLVNKPSHVYRDTVTNLARLGFEVSTRQGSSVGLSDLVSPVDKNKYFAEVEQKAKEIQAGSDPKHVKTQKIGQLYGDLANQLNKDILDAGLKKNQTLAKVILSGSRGSPTQYRQTVAAPVIVNNDKGHPLIDFPIKSSFAEGLSLPEYLAHSYGTRQGTVATKLAVADSGYFSKQLSRAAMTLRIEEHDCGTNNGIEVNVNDNDSIGCFLARPVGKYKKNNEVTPGMLADLKNNKITDMIIRSPMTCEASRHDHPWSVCQLCAGKRERGSFPMVGEYIGITSATALGEPLAQGQLNTKHQSGSASSLNKTVASGFKLISDLANIPDSFKHTTATVAEFDGTVSKIRNMPQGGYGVTVTAGDKSKEHYIPAGFQVKVHIGDKVEAGDVLSDGIVNPEEVVRYKGIGEGRRYFADVMKKTFDENGMPVNRRNFEVIARSVIDHVNITHPEGLGEHLPFTTVSYQSIEKDYKPRSDSKLLRVDLAQGKYLEVPVLHFTIGTRLSSSMIKQLQKNKIQSVTVNDNPPPFQPEMVRLLDVPSHIPDWMHQLYSIYLEKRLINAVNTAASSNIKGPSPIAGLAYSVGFGEDRAQ